MNETILNKSKASIKELIYEIRGKKVILASDVAKLYEIETKRVNEVVKRNDKRFTSDFCFQLTKEEYQEILRSQFATLELKQGQYPKYLPYVFTSDGVRTLETILRKENVREITTKILQAFEEEKEYEVIVKSPELREIMPMIYSIRGMQVMLDSDVAKLFNYETKTMNRQVLRNMERFPENYSFQLNEEEFISLRCQNGTLKNGRGQHRKYLPFVFTEYGITMLAGILNSQVAVQVSIKMVNAFIEMRKYIGNNNYNNRISNIESKLVEYDNKFEKVFNMLEPKINHHIFFEGQIYDAYSLLVDILNEAKKEVIVIDNYINKKILDILAKVNKKIKVVTSKIDDMDLEKYKEQYKNIDIKINKKFHDRFIIIDKNILYHSGASFKDLGKKCFALNKIEDKEYLEKILLYIKN